MLKRNQRNGQSILEYALVVAMAIVSLLAVNFVLAVKNNSFERHFEKAALYTSGIIIQ